MQNLPELIRELLSRRNIQGAGDLEKFLYPRLESLPHPSSMKGLSSAASKICRAIENDIEIIVWGDYDVDGTTGTALLVNFFRELGVEIQYYIPNRLAEGYGLSGPRFLERFKNEVDSGALLITVDCGISDRDAVGTIASAGCEVIVTDHHQMPIGGLPDCVVVNPNQPGCGFNGEMLAGVGVAFFLAVAVRSRLSEVGYFSSRPRPNLKQYLGFVALGTISDLVELTETNRILVKAGFEALTDSSIPGIASLLENAEISGGTITSEDISFSLGPRINAAGRLGVANVAVDLMVCDNMSVGATLSSQLEKHNEKRKKLCEECYNKTLDNDDRCLLIGKYSIVVSGDFHAGIIGIVASRIVEKFKKPTIVFARERDPGGCFRYKGSGRSIPGVNILNCLHGCSDAISRYGGHGMAAGLTVEETNFNSFARMFEEHAKLASKERNLSELIQASHDVECSIDDVMDDEFLKYFSLMEPFGPENEKPVFLDRQASIVSCKAIGSDNQHLQMVLRGKYANHRAIGFGLGGMAADIRASRKQEFYFTPMINRFRNKETWQVRVISVSV
ncbi:single-stranded-DNA-specific exonuclease RecJ [Desulfopila sp. IMCC35008]|uniref:single-stranded-DNA-specific exonuclease RecJ n=1 Tax=Desulfopila sp. IMCC35008 TaxID=2653858 RepID=UPI0013D7417A|nr:single-stranded-DNA-specific exonuclease RecJ [Desulfopila sp. IMCC35008]